jgi:CxxC-x17-CxxC domain-containing protein
LSINHARAGAARYLFDYALYSASPSRVQATLLEQIMSYADKALTCRDCGNPFTFTAGEQGFYAEKGFTNEPSRCPGCRAINKGQRSGGGGTGYDRDSGYSGGGQYSRGPREMFDAVCSECGGIARVPFQPSGDKPVYCSNCFDQRRSYR